MAGVTRERLDPRSVQAARLGGWIVTAVVLAVVSGGSLFALIRSEAPAVSWIGMGVIVAAIGGLLGLATWLGPLWSYRSTSLLVDDAGLEIARGVLWRHQISVPRSRIQHTDVTQGPVDRRFGLGTLVIYTAGTEHAAIPIEGLAHETALALRDALLARDVAAAPSPETGDAI
jgi:membrane protein YdbS with pleckstrin-like domain